MGSNYPEEIEKLTLLTVPVMMLKYIIRDRLRVLNTCLHLICNECVKNCKVCPVIECQTRIPNNHNMLVINILTNY